MKNLKILFCTVSFLLAVSCEPAKTDVNAIVEEFSDLECRAIRLREQRFELANKMRFTQDTLLQVASKADTMHLHQNLTSFNKDKEIMLQQSLSLADSIKNKLSHLMKNELNNANDKKVFNELLHAMLIKKGCITIN
jgi:hypothetical protein